MTEIVEPRSEFQSITKKALLAALDDPQCFPRKPSRPDSATRSSMLLPPEISPGLAAIAQNPLGEHLFDFRILEGNGNAPISWTALDPVMIAKNLQSAANGLEQAPRRHFDAMLDAVRVRA